MSLAEFHSPQSRRSNCICISKARCPLPHLPNSRPRMALRCLTASRPRNSTATEICSDFLKVYDLVCASVRSADDFSRVTFEALERCALAGARYVELFFSPHAHLAHGVAYATMLEGILDGFRRARERYGVVAKLIPAHAKPLGADGGERFLDMVLAERPAEVIGIGFDYDERPNPPRHVLAHRRTGEGGGPQRHQPCGRGRSGGIRPRHRRHSRPAARRPRLPCRRRSGADGALQGDWA